MTDQATAARRQAWIDQLRAGREPLRCPRCGRLDCLGGTDCPRWSWTDRAAAGQLPAKALR